MKRTRKVSTAKSRDPKRRNSTKTRTAKQPTTEQSSPVEESRAGEPVRTGEALEIRDLVLARKQEAKQQLQKSHKHVKEEIVEGLPPQNEIDIVTDMDASRIALSEYVTLDLDHYEAITNLMQGIQDYTKDPTRRRPFNIVMQAEPGSGKSHFIKSLAKRLEQDRVKDVTFNMSSLKGVEDFIQPLEDVRNLKVADEIPLLFLDEFDSNRSNYSLLLPLLWDGELSVGQRRLRIGKVVTILAGSSKEIGEVMEKSKGMKPGGDEAGKLPDLLSRINGGELKIPELDEITDTRDRRVDKVCLTIALLTRRFPSLSTVSWAFLHFVAETKFRYSVRSISHLIDSIPAIDKQKSALEMQDLNLPLDSVDELKGSSLANHLIAENGPSAVIQRWRKLKSHEVPVRFKPRLRSLKSLSFTDILRKYFEDE